MSTTRTCQYTGASYDLVASWVVTASSNAGLIGLPPSSVPGSDPTNFVDSLDFSVNPTSAVSGSATAKTVVNIVVGAAYNAGELILTNVTATGNLTAVGPSGKTFMGSLTVNGDASLTNIGLSLVHISGTVTTNGGCSVDTVSLGNVYFGCLNILGSSDMFGDRGENVGSGIITVNGDTNIGSASVSCNPTLYGDLVLTSVYIYGSSAPTYAQDFWVFSTMGGRIYLRHSSAQCLGPFVIRILYGMVPSAADVRASVTFDDGTAGTLASTYVDAGGTKIAMGAGWAAGNIIYGSSIAGLAGNYVAPVAAGYSALAPNFGAAGITPGTLAASKIHDGTYGTLADGSVLVAAGGTYVVVAVGDVRLNTHFGAAGAQVGGLDVTSDNPDRKYVVSGVTVGTTTGIFPVPVVSL